MRRYTISALPAPRFYVSFTRNRLAFARLPGGNPYSVYRDVL